MTNGEKSTESSFGTDLTRNTNCFHWYAVPTSVTVFAQLYKETFSPKGCL